MDENVKRVLWVIGILVALIIGVTIYSSINGNYEIGEFFSLGILVALFAFVFIGGFVYHLIELKKLHDSKKYVDQETVIKQKALPLYSKGTSLACICFFAVTTILFVVTFVSFSSQENSEKFGAYFWIYISMLLVGAVVFYIKLRQSKMLYLIKDNEQIINYEDNVLDLPELFAIQRMLRTKGNLINKKCEKIVLNNNIKIWSCFSKELTRYPGKGNYNTWYHSFIIASDEYKSASDFDIEIVNTYGTWRTNYTSASEDYKSASDSDTEINNSSTTYFEDNSYIPKYSNLSPFFISGEHAKIISNRIEEICSDFFSKTRSRYALIIRRGTISLGLKSARFGRVNRLFNKDKTVELTKEAIEEIANFLLKIKNEIERV